MQFNRRATLALNLLTAAFGAVLILCGIYIKVNLTVPGFWPELLLASGGAVLGTGLSSLYSYAEIFDVWGHVREAIAKSSSSRLLSVDQHLTGCRARWHHYYVTLENGHFVWSHDVIDFTGSDSAGVLTAQSSFIGRGGSSVRSKADACVMDGRLIMTIKDQLHDEPTDVCVYPFFQKPGRIKSGVEFRESIDLRHIMAPAIMSESPINGFTAIGRVDRATSALLTTSWTDDFSSTIRSADQILAAPATVKA